MRPGSGQQSRLVPRDIPVDQECLYPENTERTKGRPIARGLVSMTGAAIFLVAHLITCVMLLSYAGNAA